MTSMSDLPAYRLRRVTQHIQENLQRQLRLRELSALVHMSPHHFARLFTQSTGVPPHRFLVQRRIDEARALLAAQHRTMRSISTSEPRARLVTPTVVRAGKRPGLK